MITTSGDEDMDTGYAGRRGSPRPSGSPKAAAPQL